MGGYKSTAVASTTWCRVKRHLQKIAPVEDPNPPEDTDDKKRKRDEDGGEEEGPVKKRGKISKIVGSDDELASEVVRVGVFLKGKGGKEKKSPADKNGLTPEEDSHDGPFNCITVKGSDGEDGPASGKKKAAKGTGSKAGKIGSRKGKMNSDAAAPGKAMENGARECIGRADTEGEKKKGKSEKSGVGVSGGNGKDPEESGTADEDTILVKKREGVDAAKVDESRENAGSIEATPAEASKTNKDKNTKETKGNDATSKKVKGKLAADSDFIEAASVKKISQIKATKITTTKTTKTAKGDAKAKNSSKNTDYTEDSLVPAVEKAVVGGDKDSDLTKDGEAGTAKTNNGASVKKPRQIKSTKDSQDGCTNGSGTEKAAKTGAEEPDGIPVEKTHTATKEDKLSVKYIIADPRGSDVIPDSQDSEKT